MKTKALLTASLAGVLFFIGIQVTQAAFGISPPFLNASHLVPGATFSQTIYLVQDQPNVDTPIKVTLSLPTHIASWITVDKGLNFVIPQGVRQFPVLITVHVPQGEGLGVYSGNMVFATAPASTGEVTIALGANMAINLTVGNGIFEQYSIPYITFPAIEEGWNPRVFFRLQNDGNIPEQVDSAVLSLYDQFDTVRLAYITDSGNFPEVSAFSSKEYTAEFASDFHLGVGDYWGNVTFFKNNQIITNYKAIIHVLPPGSLSSPFEQFINSLKGYWYYYVFALIVLFVIVRRVWVMTAHRRKKRVT